MAELLKNPSFELDKAGNVIPNTPAFGFESFNAPPGQNAVQGWHVADPTLNNTFEIQNSPYGGGSGFPPLFAADGHHELDMIATNPNGAGGIRMDVTQNFSTNAAQLVNIDLLLAQQYVGAQHTPIGDHLIARLDGNVIFDYTVQNADPGAWNHILDFHATTFLGAGDHTLELTETDSHGSVTAPVVSTVGIAVDLISIHTAAGPG